MTGILTCSTILAIRIKLGYPSGVDTIDVPKVLEASDVTIMSQILSNIFINNKNDN